MSKASNSTVNFQLKGHSYRVTLHTPSTFGLFATKLLALASGPLTTLLKASDLGAAMQAGGIGELDLSGVSPSEVQDSLVAVINNISEDELRQIFSLTQRDGKDLSNDLVYDEAYRGNWAEWYQAIFQILKANGFFDFLGTPTDS